MTAISTVGHELPQVRAAHMTKILVAFDLRSTFRTHALSPFHPENRLTSFLKFIIPHLVIVNPKYSFTNLFWF